jgi:hypothetical protein
LVEFPDYIKSDPVISTLDLYGIEIIKDTYYSYVIVKLLNSIISKNNKLFDARHEFMPDVDIAMWKESPNFWSHVGDPIGLLTSKLILANSFGSINEMWMSSFESVEDILSTLQRIDSALTFKDLGVISTSDESWRPTATKIFNFAKSLSMPNPYINRECNVYIQYLEEVDLLSTSIDVNFEDPIFYMMDRKLIKVVNKYST